MNTELTITEALQELKTIDKRIQSTKDFVLKYAIRQGSTIDPLDDEGGSHKIIPARIQSLTDLFTRQTSIRHAINIKNAATKLTLGGITMSVAEWIIWRRDVKPGELSAYQQLQAKILDCRRQCQEKGMQLKDDGVQPSRVTEVSCFISEAKIQSRIEALNEIESTLDGKLSLINATTTITV
jgi:hypothetical protein